MLCSHLTFLDGNLFAGSTLQLRQIHLQRWHMLLHTLHRKFTEIYIYIWEGSIFWQPVNSNHMFFIAFSSLQDFWVGNMPKQYSKGATMHIDTALIMNLGKLFMFQYPKSTRFWEFMKNSSIIYTCMILYICIHKNFMATHSTCLTVWSSAGFAFWEVTSKGISSAPEDKICFTWLAQMVQLRKSSDANLC